MVDDDKSGRVMWILAGCVGLLTMVLCVGGGIALYLVADDQPQSGPLPSGPAPGPLVPGPMPGPAPGPGPGPNPFGPGPAPALPDLSPRDVVAVVSSGSGSMPAPAGTECRFSVRGDDQGGGAYWCNAQIVCGGRLLYGGASAGYFPCTLQSASRHVIGSDGETTAGDSDAAMSLDTTTGRLSIRDDATGSHGAYTLEARITSLR